jgi:hypothetical protein
LELAECKLPNFSGTILVRFRKTKKERWRAADYFDML